MILFGKHGRIVWSEGGKRASFQVNGVEVASFDTKTEALIQGGNTSTSPEQVLRDYLEAAYSGDVERALSLIGGPLGETPEEHARMIKTYQAVGPRGSGPPEIREWYKEGPYAITSFVPQVEGARIENETEKTSNH